MEVVSGSTRVSTVFKIVGVIFFIPLVVIILHIVELWQVNHDWQQSTGVVTKRSFKGWWNKAEHRRYYLEYQYDVNGQQFRSTRFHLKDDSIKRYTYFFKKKKKGDSIRVWYNPENPSQSVINTDYLRDSFCLLIVLAGFLVMLGTMILKGKRWQKHLDSFSTLLSLDYTGSQVLPPSDILDDRGDYLKLNVGMSIFWSVGIPFFAVSFITIAPMLYLLQEINSGWTLQQYLRLVGVGLCGGMLVSLFVTYGFKHFIEVDTKKRKLSHIQRSFFKVSRTEYDFDDISEVKGYKEQWRADNSMRNPVLLLVMKSSRTLFISFRHRDIQPAIKEYLEILKQRLEYLFR